MLFRLLNGPPGHHWASLRNVATRQQAGSGGNSSSAGEPTGGAGSGTAVPGLVEQLTSRELEVLEMRAAGRPNRAIAGQLVVTLDTIKKHVSHVLGKLGAANRTEAVTRARELGLIP